MKRSHARLAPWCVAFLVAACGPDNQLSGSLSEVFPLTISTVAIARNDEALQVTYILNRDAFVDVVARVSVSMADLTLKLNKPIPLGGEVSTGVLRCVVTHAPGGEPVRNLPHVMKGELVLTHGGNPGEETRGNFSMSFATDGGGDLGAGRTLTGTFAATATDAGFEPEQPNASP